MHSTVSVAAVVVWWDFKLLGWWPSLLLMSPDLITFILCHHGM